MLSTVALERDVLEILRRRHAETLLDGRLVEQDDVGDPAAVEHHVDPGTDELEEVAVGGHDHGVQAGLRGPVGERADRVVRLVIDDTDHRDVQRVEHLIDQAELRGEVRRRLRPTGLVLGVLLQTHGRPAEVERDRQIVGMLVAHQLDQHRREAVDGVRDLPGARGERGAGARSTPGTRASARPAGRSACVRRARRWASRGGFYPSWPTPLRTVRARQEVVRTRTRLPLERRVR